MDWDLGEGFEDARRAANKGNLERKLKQRDDLGGVLVLVSTTAFFATLILMFASDSDYVWGGWLPESIGFFVYFGLVMALSVSFVGGLGSLLDIWLLRRTIPGDRVPSTPWTTLGYLAGCGLTVWLAYQDFF